MTATDDAGCLIDGLDGVDQAGDLFSYHGCLLGIKIDAAHQVWSQRIELRPFPGKAGDIDQDIPGKYQAKLPAYKDHFSVEMAAVTLEHFKTKIRHRKIPDK